MKLAYPTAGTPERTPAQWADHHRRVVAILIALGLLGSYPMGVFFLAIMTAPHPQPAAPAPIRGAGVVLSMNDSMSAITVQHSGVPQLNLGPGSTSFRADPSVFKRTEVGDLLTFDLVQENGVYTITRTQPSAAPDEAAPLKPPISSPNTPPR